MKKLSSGMKKDLLVVTLCNSMLKIANTPNAQGSVQVGLYREKLASDIEKIIRILSKSLAIDVSQEDSRYMQKKLQEKVAPLLQKIGNLNVEMNSLAIYLLYFNFLDLRKLKVDEIFTPILEMESFIFETLDLLCASVQSSCDEMYELADQCITFLKS